MDALANVALVRKYRPTRLSEVLGQAEVIRSLKLYAKRPYTTAMIFHGESGVGKTSAAYALAAELGVRMDEGEFGGFRELPSGSMNGVAVEEELRRLRHKPMFSKTGWSVLVANEADRMTAGAEDQWLDGLERGLLDLPQKLIIFTTNELKRMSERFVSRCEVYAFTSETARLRQSLKALAKKVWKAEGCRGLPPGLEFLGLPTLTGADSMHANFRLMLQQLTHLIREAQDGQRNGKGLSKVVTRLMKDREVYAGETGHEIACDHCGHKQDMPIDAEEILCGECGKVFLVEGVES